MIEWLSNLSTLQQILLALASVLSWCIGFGMGMYARGHFNAWMRGIG